MTDINVAYARALKLHQMTTQITIDLLLKKVPHSALNKKPMVKCRAPASEAYGQVQSPSISIPCQMLKPELQFYVIGVALGQAGQAFA